MDAYDLQRTVAQAHRTQAFRESEEYQRAFAAVMENLFNGLLAEQDEQKRLAMLRYLDSLQAIDGQLMNAIEDGLMAEAELKRIEHEPE